MLPKEAPPVQRKALLCASSLDTLQGALYNETKFTHQRGIAMNRPYYLAYEERYRKVHALQALWGHSPQDEELRSILSRWVETHNLAGKHIAEFACGEGGSGVILSEAGCIWHGFDAAPSAVDRARLLTEHFPNAHCEVRDLIHQPLPAQSYDAALDVMGLHMLVTDSDRRAYLQNMFNCLKGGASALLVHESFRTDAYEGNVSSIEEWARITGLDFHTPQPRRIPGSDEITYLPLLPARPKNQAGYISEMEDIGFVVEEFMEMGENEKCIRSACIRVKRPL